MAFIFNPLHRLPSEEEARAQFAKANLEMVDFTPRKEGAWSYPCVYAMTSDGRVFNLDMLHGGGTIWEQC